MSAAASRRALVFALGAAAAAGCASGGGGRSAVPDPRAIIVVPPLDAGQTAASSPDPGGPSSEEPAPFELALDNDQLCVRSAGRIHCTSDPTPERALTSAPALEGIDDAISLALGRGFGCVATRAGTVLCFGENTEGQLGAKLRAPKSDKPVAVAGITSARVVVAGAAHACAILRDGTVRCWGRNGNGQTGGSTSYLPAARELIEPDLVPGVKEVTGLAAGARTTCAATRSREITCWGEMAFSSGGTPRATKNTPPVVVPDLARTSELTASEGAFCGILDGDVRCWGDLYSLVAGSTWRSAKMVMAGVPRARRVRATQGHACAILFDGDVTCFGTNYDGSLGRGETAGYETLAPERVAGVSSVVDIAVGGGMSCALTGAREVYCWGSWPHTGRTPRKEPLPVKMHVSD